VKEKLIGIGAAAKLTGLSERTLRYWESLSLIVPIRVSSGHRKYSKNMVKKIISLKETLESNNLRINDLITSSAFLEDEVLKKKVKDIRQFNVGGENGEAAKNKKIPNKELVNPLTGLLNNFFIQAEIEKRLSEGKKIAICYIDLRNFRAYNVRYGYQRGDKVIKFTAKNIANLVKDYGMEDDVVGHLGGDNFVVITKPEKYPIICFKIIQNFDNNIGDQYDKEDLNNGYIININRKGDEIKHSIMSLSVAVVTNERRNLAHAAQIDDIAKELKRYAQKMKKSDFVVDKRTS